MADTVLKKEDKNKAKPYFFVIGEKMTKDKKKVIKEILTYGLIIIAVILVKAFVVSPIRVNGDSMYNTLHDQDIMILNETSYWFNDIERFDIVVIKSHDEYLIKRVIGLPGEKIECRDGQIYINGKKIKDKYAYSETDDFDKVEINDNEYFVLGDNRDDSLDSRVFGVFKKKDIKGKATMTIYPFKRFGVKK